MNICGIVCEYNPFHNGHLYHIKETKKSLDCGIICIMSGNYVQRGEFALFHKRERARAAVLCGADVVIELPLPWAVSTAERFSHGAISLLDALGSVTHISFGSEFGDVKSLQSVVEILCDERFDELLLKHYQKGISYAQAREKAVQFINPELSPLLKHPNNILGIEYIKALSRRKSKIIPFTVSRRGAMHDSEIASDTIASASFIRATISSQDEIKNFLPKASFDVYKSEFNSGHTLVSSDEISRAILAHLKTLSADDFLRFGDVSEGLQFRLYDAVSKSSSLAEAVYNAASKRYTYARVCRCFLNAFLNVENTLCREDVPYARVLAFNNCGRKILKTLKNTSTIPIITKPSAINNESEKLRKLFALEKSADDIYSLFMRNPVSQGSTFTQSPVYVRNGI